MIRDVSLGVKEFLFVLVVFSEGGIFVCNMNFVCDIVFRMWKCGDVERFICGDKVGYYLGNIFNVNRSCDDKISDFCFDSFGLILVFDGKVF